jgi:predicted tellurium resistance membrane protein TerC
MERMPIIVVLGAALLGYLAGQMLATDPALAAWFDAHLPHPEAVFGVAGAILVVVVGRFLHRRRRTAAGAV